ncbi:16S rRNA (uracil(1498)-N(3))-methyltransferase [Sphingorhabdus pulchriflava]|uniref:Ribosomal RNA small subunit methyltransferase E n=1 Tax=Sphingorhabdus pulchriflava TaxID=2292257 RepID=A0A371B4Y3_9SPHN|nr:16S rRNA (uracil(1498)-N(3))-methyltransferase [Sphingorhabdus pulchriflava]RDV02649.1 16S rRNA (uracil(1498)-N(3))-methyltransferase [Sphingorhabdus pulchriflava]
MVQTPAWPPHSTPRLFVDEALTEGSELRIEGGQAHYLLHVMRLKEGAPVKLFDDRTGEYLATVTATGKRDLVLTVEAKLRERETTPDLWLCQALIKKDRLDWIAEKSCELGIARFVPVLTQRCVADKLKEDRLRSQMIEAAEQCERTALPEIGDLSKLDALLRDWPEDRSLLFCDERGGTPLAEVLVAGSHRKSAILIGPEGGFSDDENADIRAHPQAVAVSLGSNILRADTAAIAAIAVWTALNPTNQG